MPLYDIVCLFKAAASRREIVDIMTSVGKRVYARNGVVTDINSYGMQPLGYQIRRQGTRFDEAHLMQMTFMAPTPIVEELHVLQQDDRLLRHTVLKHRPFWKEEVVDNQAWARLMTEATAAKATDYEGDEELPPLEAFDEDDDDHDIEFVADELDATVEPLEVPSSSRRRFGAMSPEEASGRPGVSGRGRGSGRGSRTMDDLDEGHKSRGPGGSLEANAALEKWRSMFRGRQDQRRRGSRADDDDDA